MTYYLSTFNGVALPLYYEDTEGTQIGLGPTDSPTTDTVNGVYRVLGDVQALPQTGREISYEGDFVDDLFDNFKLLAAEVGKKKQLTRITDDGDTHTILAELLDMPRVPRSGATHQTLKFTFRLWEPFWRDTNQITQSFASGFSTTSAALQFGNVPLVDPTFKIVVSGGTMTSFNLWGKPTSGEATNRFHIYWSGSIAGSDTITIDCATGAMTRQSGATIIDGVQLNQTYNSVTHTVRAPFLCYFDPAGTTYGLASSGGSVSLKFDYYKRWT